MRIRRICSRAAEGEQNVYRGEMKMRRSRIYTTDKKQSQPRWPQCERTFTPRSEEGEAPLSRSALYLDPPPNFCKVCAMCDFALFNICSKIERYLSSRPAPQNPAHHLYFPGLLFCATLASMDPSDFTLFDVTPRRRRQSAISCNGWR